MKNDAQIDPTNYSFLYLALQDNLYVWMSQQQIHNLGAPLSASQDESCISVLQILFNITVIMNASKNDCETEHGSWYNISPRLAR